MTTQTGPRRRLNFLGSIRPAWRSRRWSGSQPAPTQPPTLRQNQIPQMGRRRKSHVAANDHHLVAHRRPPLSPKLISQIVQLGSLAFCIFGNIYCASSDAAPPISDTLRQTCVASGVFPDDASLQARILWFQHARADGLDRDAAFRTVMRAMEDRSWRSGEKKFTCQTCLLLLIDEAYGPTPPASASPGSVAPAAE